MTVVRRSGTAPADFGGSMRQVRVGGSRRSRAELAAAAALGAVLSWGRPASADFGSSLEWISVGANVGASSESDETHWLLGTEVSAGRAELFVWGGAYLDALYDTGTQRVRVSFGPEIGIFFLGLDGGPVFDVGGGKVRPGLVIRPMIALKFVFPYARFGVRVGDDASSFSELGVLLKYPFIDERP